PSVYDTTYVAAAAQALTPGHDYTMTVYAISANGSLSTAARQAFSLAALPAPTALTPSDTVAAADGFDRPTFAWTAAAGADHYFLSVVDKATGAKVIVMTSISGLSYHVTANQALTPGHTYTASVYAVSTAGQMSAAVTQTFTLAVLTAPTG